MSRGQMKERRATHAGSWYTDNPRELEGQLDKWLSDAESVHSPARAIIVPHAGYSYSGAVAAHAFKQVSPASFRRVFILGPSHVARLSACAVTAFSTYATPLSSLTVDKQINEELISTGHFSVMSQQTDEDEHSIEMMLPYIAHCFKGQQLTVVPILVGSLSGEKEDLYGSLLRKYLQDPQNLFVISSDFCHWGDRFSYQPGKGGDMPIYMHIQQLDKQGMDLIESKSHAGFRDYLSRTQNTICGRRPIGVLLKCMDHLNCPERLSLKFVKYSQSERVQYPTGSSVSYASASLTIA